MSLLGLRSWAEILGEIVQYAVFEECQQLRSLW